MPWVKALTTDEKAVIAAVCERFIADTLKPRFLPVIRPTSSTIPSTFSADGEATNTASSRAIVPASPKISVKSSIQPIRALTM